MTIEEIKMENCKNEECAKAIKKAITEKFDGYYLPKNALDDVITEHGEERVQMIIAARVNDLAGFDGRISRKAVELAKQYKTPKNIDFMVYIDTIHSCLLNNLAETYLQ